MNRFQSSLFIHRRPLMLSRSCTASLVSARLTSTSERAKSPIATDQEFEAIHQLRIAEGVAGHPALEVNADGCDGKSEEGRKQCLDK